MGLLSNTRVYLAGPVEQDNDPNGWRNSIKGRLNELGIICWDPLDKPVWIDRSFTGVAQRADKHELVKLSGCGSAFAHNSVYARNVEIRRVALRLASAADFVICKIGGPTVGTFEELALAKTCLKPVLFFGEIDSSWRCVQFLSNGYTAFHPTMDALLEYLNDVDKTINSVSPVDWIFLDKHWPSSKQEIKP